MLTSLDVLEPLYAVYRNRLKKHSIVSAKRLMLNRS